MQPASTEKAVAPAARPRMARLLRVLVAGGIALAGACATAPRSGETKEGDQAKAPPSKPADPGGGVQGW